MKYLSLFAVAVAASLASINQSAFASSLDSNSFYVSSSIGLTSVSGIKEYSDDDGNDSDEQVVFDTDIVDSGMSFMLVGGYQFYKGFSAELGYLNLGEASLDENAKHLGGASGAVVAEVDEKIVFNASGFVTGAGYVLPINDVFSLKGRLGLFLWDLDIDFKQEELVGSDLDVDEGSVSSDGTDIYFGVGATYRMSNTFELFADWSRYRVSYKPAKKEHDVDVFEVGVTYYFGGNNNRSRTRNTQQTMPAQSTHQSNAVNSNNTATTFKIEPRSNPQTVETPLPQKNSRSETRQEDKSQKSSSEALACDEKYKHLFGICQ